MIILNQEKRKSLEDQRTDLTRLQNVEEIWKQQIDTKERHITDLQDLIKVSRKCKYFYTQKFSKPFII